MGIDYCADLGYGFKISKEIDQKISSGQIKVDRKIFDIIWSGDAYNGDMISFLVIAKSSFSTWSFVDGEPIKASKLIADVKWDRLLKDFAKENNITKPKIGWWLCSSVF